MSPTLYRDILEGRLFMQKIRISANQTDFPLILRPRNLDLTTLPVYGDGGGDTVDVETTAHGIPADWGIGADYLGKANRATAKFYNMFHVDAVGGSPSTQWAKIEPVWKSEQKQAIPLGKILINGVDALRYTNSEIGAVDNDPVMTLFIPAVESQGLWLPGIPHANRVPFMSFWPYHELGRIFDDRITLVWAHMVGNGVSDAAVQFLASDGTNKWHMGEQFNFSAQGGDKNFIMRSAAPDEDITMTATAASGFGTIDIVIVYGFESDGFGKVQLASTDGISN